MAQMNLYLYFVIQRRTDEVAQVAWMNREQIKELFDANMFVETLEYFFTEVDKKWLVNVVSI